MPRNVMNLAKAAGFYKFITFWTALVRDIR